MLTREYYMQRCLELALNGLGNVAPNPMVGCVIVHDGNIIGEGYHQCYGEAHAEVNAIHSVKNKSLLEFSTLYVNLEPCAHFGKTPPCCDLIVANKIPTVVIGCKDIFSAVNGHGIKKLKEAGVYVIENILEKESRFLNRRFFCSIKNNRPYIILKWAETLDGFMDIKRLENQTDSFPISANETKIITHKWRTEEQAIMVGTNTALIDNPNLTARDAMGKNPIRILIDKNLIVPPSYHIFNEDAKTIVFNKRKNGIEKNIDFVKLEVDESEFLNSVLEILYQKNIQSVIIEGGAKLLNSLIKDNLWDEARTIISQKKIENGLPSPGLKEINYSEKYIFATDSILIYYNP